MKKGGSKMNTIEKKYFELLHKDRSDSADVFEKPANRGLWRSVVEKYRDQAHFIYELIQNADDAGATSARFVLEKERLIFAHNGKRHFSISDPQLEGEDADKGQLGDVNSITGIAFSAKQDQPNKIGKFGVGFKAVFQYTSTPHIYDPNLSFRIDRYIVPTLLDEDFPGRKSDETLFVFPFNHKEKTAKDTYKDIEGKLRALSYPILFLTNLRDINYEINGQVGLYGKDIVGEQKFSDGTVAEKLRLSQNKGEEIVHKNLWLFTRKYDGLKYSVGYFFDETDNIIPVSEYAYCFFPTKETTKLNFIIHAPFLLTDSREGIKAGEKHNTKLISLLANLSADSLVYLRDIGEKSNQRLITDRICKIIPINEEIFEDADDVSNISFKPFYVAIKKVFGKERIIPTRDSYVSVKDAYWAAVPNLAELFDDNQLAELTGNVNAKWAFVSYGRDELQRTNKHLYEYIDSITFTYLSEQHLVKGRKATVTNWWQKTTEPAIIGITSKFIEHQSLEWLTRLYKWLSETSNRTELAKYAPVLLDQDSKAIAAYDKNDHMMLFLPNEDIPNCRVVRKDLLEIKEAKNLISKLQISAPSLRDEIYNVILPLYKDNNADIDNDAHFNLFFKYYKQCPQEEVESYIDEIKNCAFMNCSCAINPTIYRDVAKNLYFPSKELCEYFETTPTTNFVEYDEYLNLVGKSNEKQLKSFLIELGVRQQVEICSRDIYPEEERKRTDLPRPYSTHYRKYKECYIDGCKGIVHHIASNNAKDKSIILWNQLLKINESCGWRGIDGVLVGTCEYFYRNNKWEYFTTQTETLLQTSKWLLNNKGEFVTPKDITRTTISDCYNLSDPNAKAILDFLGINDEIPKTIEEDKSNLTDDQREKVEFAERLIELGITDEDILALTKIKKARDAKAVREEKQQVEKADIDEIISDLVDTENADAGDIATRNNHGISKIAKDILQRTQKSSSTVDVNVEEDNYVDADEFQPAPVDYSKKAELAKEKAAREIEKLVHEEELQQKALDAKKYTYGWFKALLELEMLNNNANALDSREVSISFARVEREPNTNRTLVLKQPSRYIPQFMEDLTDIPLVLHFADQTKTLAIEVANVKSYTLRVKLKSHVDISDIDFSKVTEARIDAKSPTFLLAELAKQLDVLGDENEYEDSFDMQENLCENIEFVFGPPGTGKTTHLAKEVLIPLMQGSEEPKVLVLTPTNKSADVLVRRIMEVMGENTSYNDWLVRFGGTGDEGVENSPVFRDKSFDIRTLKKHVTVTTIARFPYDFFMPQGSRMFLNGMKWDYIIIDEASMVPLVNIIYPLYKKTPKKFIIAGDPFQIEPITSVDLWRNENIYTMVHLDSFTEPHTIPHEYPVKLLTTQYRSIPSVGTVFSEFAYGGILNHHRSEESRKNLNIDKDLQIEPINIIKFPVSKYESIYRSKRLQQSSAYQVYSALFTFEFAHYFAKKISDVNPRESFRIGIIAPYRAQSDLIEKLISSNNAPSNVDIQVGTIHGFQGDECDAIFVVLNTPPYISSSPDMFLNKRNIINVSISRAKDYLFLIMPDNETENIHNLRLVKRVEQIVKKSGCYVEYNSPELEERMFGSVTYLEDNAFSTGHQSVNVYGLPEKRYEIRSEDTAVDVQIHHSVQIRAEESKSLSVTSNENISSNQGRMYRLGDVLIGRKVKIHFDNGNTIVGTVSDDYNGYLTVQTSDASGRAVTQKHSVPISLRAKMVYIF